MTVDEFVANYEDIELAKMNYVVPGSGVTIHPEQAHLSKIQKVNLARGGSPRASQAMASPKARASAIYTRAGSGGRK